MQTVESSATFRFSIDIHDVCLGGGGLACRRVPKQSRALPGTRTPAEAVFFLTATGA